MEEVERKKPLQPFDTFDPSVAQKGGSSSFTQWRLMMKKNWILKKRAICSTIMEIFVPLCAFLILLMIRGLVEIENVNETINAQDTVTAVSRGWNTIESAACGYGYKFVTRAPNQSIALAPNNPADLPLVINLTTSLQGFFLTQAARQPIISCTGGFDVDATSYVGTSMFRVFNSPSALEDYYLDKNYGADVDHPPLLMGIILQQSGPAWSYTVRLNISDVPWTGMFMNNLLVGYDRSLWRIYSDNFELTVQLVIDQFIMQTQAGITGPEDVSFTPYPTPSYKQDNFADYVGDTFGLFLVMAYMWPFSCMVRNLVTEKELKLREGMRMMGMRNSAFWLSWIATYMILFFILVILVLLITKGSLFPYSDWGILFFFFFSFSLAVIAAACLVSAFFSRARTAGTLSRFLLLVTWLPYSAVSGTGENAQSSSSKGLACLLAPVAFSLGSTNILKYEQAFQGATASNSAEELDNFALGTAIGMMFFDAVLYGFLAWYLEKVWPTEYGTQMPWYFPFTIKYWKESCCCYAGAGNPEEHPLLINASEAPDFGTDYEPVPAALSEQGGVKIRGLRKEFPGEDGNPFVAVAGLNLDMYSGQVFVLLGHNGAGKTTTINMMTGMTAPSSGLAEVYGYSVTNQMTDIRKFMGVCPQHDVLFDLLTVKEHLEIFGRMKGVPEHQLRLLVDDAIREVQLEEKVDAQTRTLSGGQKRRLSLAIALIGDSKIVYLDEPTSGVDPSSRRAIWDLLARKKAGRVIILTTHFMDEADQLGDRIAILHKGQLKCCGSSLFLKRKFGVGYNITFTLEAEGAEAARSDAKEQREKKHQQRTKLTAMLRSFVPQADCLSDVGAELMFRLPLAASPQFPELLNNLDDKKEEFGVVSYGLSVTTLEEVFLKVAADQAHNVEEGEEAKALIRSISERRGSQTGTQYEKEMGYLEATAESSFWTHFKALIVKRFHITKRDKRAGCCQFLLPVILILVGLGILRIPPNQSFPTVNFDAALVPAPNIVPYSSYMWDEFVGGVSNQKGVTMTSTPIEYATNTTTFSQYLLDTKDGQSSSRYGAYFQDPSQPNDELSNYTYYAFNNMTFWHGLPTWLNTANQGLLRNVTGNPNTGIKTSLSPFKWTWREQATIQNVNGIFASIIISMGFVFIPASYATFIVKEREEKSKHLQLISGVSIYAYWISSYFWDFINFLPPAFISAFIVLAYGNEVFTGSNFPVLLLAFILYGLSVIPFTYCFTFAFKSHTTAQNVMIMVYLVGGIVLTMVNFALYAIPSTREANQLYIRHLFRLIPNFCLGDSIFYLSIRGFLGNPAPGALDNDVTGFDLAFMAWESVAYFILALVLEKLSSIPSFVAAITPVNDPGDDADSDAKLDDDVRAERERIRAGQAADDLIRIEGLRKVYPPRKVAVRDVWFGVPAGECFGFLGVNGAGKTTTIRILTGDEIPTRGEAYLGGLSILDQPTAVRRLMGYCPQFDALHANLTARETLTLYGHIRGIPDQKLPLMVDFLINRLALGDYADREAGKYSGGNRRKLSVAIALIGNPPIVFLDEPSTGIDPVSRRSMWDFLSETMARRAVILTTHSMEECEALCSRIGIISAGQLRCIGSSQRLKTRFGRGLQIEVSTGAADPSAARAFITSTFPGAEELEAYGGHLRYQVEAKESLSRVFAQIEANKERVGIAEYSVGQTTLEQIFVNFAREADEELREQLGIPKAQRIV